MVAEDLTSEVFIRMLKALPDYQVQKTPFQAWLFQIARFLAIDHFRANHRHKVEPLEDNLATDDIPLDRIIDDRLAVDRLQKALAALPEDQRDVLVFRFLLNMPIGEVAEAMHRSPNAIKGLQRRGLRALRSMYEQMENIR
jgi:RNA polymerase sigma-70 factor (ECF subfamily)